jgi:hypothetical protein
VQKQWQTQNLIQRKKQSGMQNHSKTSAAAAATIPKHAASMKAANDYVALKPVASSAFRHSSPCTLYKAAESTRFFVTEHSAAAPKYRARLQFSIK